jgi:hypothetical protein
MQDMDGYLMSQLVGVVQAGPIVWVDTQGSRQRKVAANAIADASFLTILPFSPRIVSNLTTLPPPPSWLSSELAIPGSLLLFLGPRETHPAVFSLPIGQLLPETTSTTPFLARPRPSGTTQHTQGVEDFTPKNTGYARWGWARRTFGSSRFASSLQSPDP